MITYSQNLTVLNEIIIHKWRNEIFQILSKNDVNINESFRNFVNKVNQDNKRFINDFLNLFSTGEIYSLYMLNKKFKNYQRGGLSINYLLKTFKDLLLIWPINIGNQMKYRSIFTSDEQIKSAKKLIYSMDVLQENLREFLKINCDFKLPYNDGFYYNEASNTFYPVIICIEKDNGISYYCPYCNINHFSTDVGLNAISCDDDFEDSLFTKFEHCYLKLYPFFDSNKVTDKQKYWNKELDIYSNEFDYIEIEVLD